MFSAVSSLLVTVKAELRFLRKGLCVWIKEYFRSQREKFPHVCRLPSRFSQRIKFSRKERTEPKGLCVWIKERFRSPRGKFPHVRRRPGRFSSPKSNKIQLVRKNRTERRPKSLQFVSLEGHGFCGINVLFRIILPC